MSFFRVFQRPKVFISYDREDKSICNEFANWINSHKIEPLVDTEEIEHGDELDIAVKAMINRCDAVICLGTSNSFQSDWCRQEVKYTRSQRPNKPYYPVLMEDIRDEEIPRWFKGSVLPGQSEINYQKITRLGLHINGKKLLAYIKGLKKLSLVWLVLFFLMFSLLIPVLALAVLKYWFLPGLSNDLIRREQSRIETINKEIKNADEFGKHEATNLVKINPSKGERDYLYVEKDTGEIVARDSFVDGILSQRLYFEQDRMIAKDSFSVQRASNNSVSLLKTREIYPREEDLIIIDRYDSIGNLISKEARRREDSGWERYADTGYSAYPLGLIPYR